MSLTKREVKMAEYWPSYYYYFLIFAIVNCTRALSMLVVLATHSLITKADPYFRVFFFFFSNYYTDTLARISTQGISLRMLEVPSTNIISNSKFPRLCAYMLCWNVRDVLAMQLATHTESSTLCERTVEWACLGLMGSNHFTFVRGFFVRAAGSAIINR